MEIDAQHARAARVQMAMGGSGTAAARALRLARESAATGTTRGRDSQDIANFYASMKIESTDDQTTAAKAPSSAECLLLNLPEDCFLSLLCPRSQLWRRYVPKTLAREPCQEANCCIGHCRQVIPGPH